MKDNGTRGKYAFCISLTNRGKFNEKNLNFKGLSNRDFYDEIEKTERRVKTSLSSLGKLKRYSIKESVYTNRKIPSDWQTHLNYQKDVFNLLESDRAFINYVADQKEEIKPLHLIPKKSEFPSIEDMKNPFSERSGVRNASKRDTRMRTSISIPYNKVQEKVYTNQEIESLMDELKETFNFKKYQKSAPDEDPERRKILRIIKEKKREKEEKNKKVFSQFSVLEQQRKKVKIIKNSIYDKLLSQEEKEKFKILQENAENPSPTPTVKKKPKFEIKSNYEILSEPIEITNPIVKRELEIINYYGPRYTHCKICHHKNLEFYKNNATNQTLKILNFLKKDLKGHNIDNI